MSQQGHSANERIDLGKVASTAEVNEIRTWTFANLAQNGNGSALAQLRPVTRERG